MIVSCVIAAGVTLSLLPNIGAQQNKKSKAAAVAVPAFGNADAINENELKVYEYYLASDQLEGRNFPSRGYDAAALYVASHLAEWGLKPGGSTTGTDGPLQPYFLPMEMVARQIVPEESKLTLTAPPAAGGRGGFGGQGGGGGGGGGARGGRNADAEPRTTTFEYQKDWAVNAGGGRGATAQALDISLRTSAATLATAGESGLSLQFSTLKLVRFPHSLAVTLHSFTFYVDHPVPSILLSAL